MERQSQFATGCGRTPTETQQARWQAVRQAREQGFSLRAIARNLGMAKNTAKEVRRGWRSTHQETQRQGASQAEALVAPLVAAN